MRHRKFIALITALTVTTVRFVELELQFLADVASLLHVALYVRDEPTGLVASAG